MSLNAELKKTVIHPTAIVHPNAKIAEGVEIGPYAIIEENVSIGFGTKVGARVTIEGYTEIGKENQIFTGAVIGSMTQDKKCDGGISYLKIGNSNIIREYVTMNPGTLEGTKTIIGNGNLFMAYAHVAHDCIVGNYNVIANNGTLAGHVIVEDRAIIGGLSGVHQLVRIGSLAIVGGCSKVVQDVPSFMMVDGHPAKAFGVNGVGLERNDVSSEERMILKKAFKIIFRSGLALKSAISKLEEDFPASPALTTLIEFLQKSERGICR